MDVESEKVQEPDKGEPARDLAYEPPLIRELGSLRDLVAGGGNTQNDGHGPLLIGG